MTRDDPDCHHRRSIRLKGYDYTQPGAYFITICTHEQVHLFGAVVDGTMVLNRYGEIVRDEWFKTAAIRPYVRLDETEFVVMPNHVHGIIWIMDDVVGATRRVAPTWGDPPRVAPTRGAPTRVVPMPTGPAPGSIGAMIGQFKSAVTKRLNALPDAPGLPIWQRNYYEHIIRDERALDAIRRYIDENPLRWHLDRYNPDRTGDDPLAREIWEMMRGAPHPTGNDDGGAP